MKWAREISVIKAQHQVGSNRRLRRRHPLDSGIDVIGVSSLAAGHKTLMPQLVQALVKRGGDGIIVICGGVIPRQDYDYLMENGVAAVFGPGTNVLDAANSVLALLQGIRRNR